MDISNWGIGQIMQLPDHLFGRRFVVCTRHAFVGIGSNFEISVMAFPERMVIWEIFAQCSPEAGNLTRWRMCFGDEVPANDAAMSLLEPVLPGMVTGTVNPGSMTTHEETILALTRLRSYRETGGKRLVSGCYAGLNVDMDVNIYITVSGVPREVPDWMISGLGRSQ